MGAHHLAFVSIFSPPHNSLQTTPPPPQLTFLPGPPNSTAPQKIAKIFGGLATPPGTLHGSLVMKKLHRPSLAHVSARPSSQNSSPMGVPKPARSTSCRAQSSRLGQASKDG